MTLIDATIKQQIGVWFFAARPCRNGLSGFIAWCKRSDLSGEGPMEEFGDVYFEFGSTADEAIALLAREVGAT
jgi:hypothetical protein